MTRRTQINAETPNYLGQHDCKAELVDLQTYEPHAIGQQYEPPKARILSAFGPHVYLLSFSFNAFNTASGVMGNS